MNIRKFLSFTVILTVAFNVIAASSYRNGTIVAVDIDNRTISVTDDETGETMEYNLPKRINVFDTGINRPDPSFLKPGQSVKLRFSHPTSDSNDELFEMHSGNLEITGTVISFDRVEGRGVLRESDTNTLIPFRFDFDADFADIPKPGDVVVFTISPEKSGSDSSDASLNAISGDNNPPANPLADMDNTDGNTRREIEVSNRMIQAGLDAFYDRNNESDSMQEVIERIYRAMAREVSQ